jgi:hypothetical protein
MKLYKIEKGVKVPPPAKPTSNGRPSIAAATMQQLERGESFFIKDALDALIAQKKMRDMNARQRTVAGGRRFVARKAGTGTRIWRVK